MMERSAFDHQRDPKLGRIIRGVLAGEDDAAFVRRVLSAVPLGQTPAPWWEVLRTWAGPGLAAAGLLTAAAALWSVTAFRGANGTGSLGDPLPATGARAAVPTYLVATDVPDVDAVMAFVSESE